jgi:hypothetical protein
MSARKILVIKNSDEIHYRHKKNHHNYASEPVYDNFIKFLMTFSCLHHKSTLSYKNHHKQQYLMMNFISS